MTNIEIVCPTCKLKLEQKKDTYFCNKCLKQYQYYVINDTLIIDFNSLDLRNCKCNRDGISYCIINLRSDLPKKLSKNKSNGKYYFTRKEKLILEEINYNKKILDLGCAEGPYSHLFIDNNESYGFDVCPKRMLLNDNNALDKGYRALIVGDCLNLPFTNNYFDIVICTEMIEHVTETRQLIKEINRVLRKKGKLILSTPNLVSLGNRIGMIIGKGLKFNTYSFLKNGFYPLVAWREGGITKRQCSFESIRYPDQPLHVRFFTFESLRKFLNQNGFIVEKEIGIDLTPTIFDPYICKIFKNWVDDLFVVAIKKD